MSDSIETPDPFVPRHLLKRITDDLSIREEHRLNGLFLLADLSQFTRLTDLYSREQSGGAERIARTVNQYFEPIIERILNEGGSILQFAGDSLLAYFPRTGGSIPWSGLRVAAQLVEEAEATEPVSVSDREINPGLQIGLDSGIARGMTVRLSDNRYDYITLGSPLNRLAEMESELSANMIGVAAELLNELSDRPQYTSQIYQLNDFRDQVVQNLPGDTAVEPIESAIKRDSFPFLDRFSPPDITEQRQLLGNQSQWMAEKRRVTPLFMNVSLGAEPERQRIDRLYQSYYEIIRDHGGTFLSSDLSKIGITVLALFGAPKGQEYHEERALDSALELRTMDHAFDGVFNRRFGLASGQVLCGLLGDEHRRMYTALGNAVNTAARSMEAAGWNEIIAHTSTIDHTRGQFEVEPDTLSLDGKSEPVSIGRVTGKRIEQPIREQTDHLLVGRDQQQRRFQERLDEGEPFALSLEGPAGSGKTSLIENWQNRWEDTGNEVVRVSCVPNEVSNPYLTWRQALWQYFNLGRNPDEERLREEFDEIHEHDVIYLREILGLETEYDHGQTPEQAHRDRRGLIQRIIKQSGKTLWIIDDTHWMDEESLDILQSLTRDPVEGHIIIGQRSETSSLDLGASVERIPLSGIDLDAAQILCRETLGTDVLTRVELERLHEKTDGNPLFLRELFRLIDEQGTDTDVPDTIQDLLQASVDRLKSIERQVLRSASIIGDTFYVDLLNEIVPIDLGREGLLEVIERLETKGFVRRKGEEEVTFQNALMYETVYENVPSGLRNSIHERIAQQLEERERSPVDLVAHHFHQAEIPEKAGEYSLKAGRQSARTHEYSRAQTFFERAEGWYRTLSDEQRLAEVLHHKGDALKTLGQYSDAQEAYQSAERYYLKNGNVIDSAIVRDQVGVCLQREGNHEEAPKHSRGALDRLPDESNTDVKRAKAQCLNSLTVAYWYTGNYQKSIKHGRQSLDLREELEDDGVLSHGLFGLGNSYAVTCQFEEARNCFRMLLDRSRETEDLAGMAYGYDGLGVCARDTGRYSDAIEYHRKSHELRSELGDPRSMCYSTIGGACTWLKIGHDKRTRSLLDRAERELEGTEETNLQGELKRVEGLYQLVNHRPDKANRYFEEAVDMAEDSGFLELQVKSMSPLAHVHLQKDQTAQARQIAESVLSRASDVDILDYDIWARLMIGDCDWRESNQPDALDHWSEAQQLSEDHVLRPLELQALKRRAYAGDEPDQTRIDHLVETMSRGLDETSREFLVKQSRQVPKHLLDGATARSA